MTPLCRRALVLSLLAAAPLLLARGTAAAPPPPSPEVPWYPVPLYGGPVFALAVGPGATGQPLLAAGGEEVFTSHRAEVWTAAQPRVGRVGSLLVAEGGVLYASNPETGEGYRSTNSGKSFNQVRLRGSEPVRFLAASPIYKTDGLVFGITTEDWRLYRNDRGDSSWIEIVYISGVPHQTGAVAISPQVQSDETIFSGTDHGLYKSTDKAQTWTLVSTAAEGVPDFGAKAGAAASQGLVLPKEYGDDPLRLGDPVIRTLFAFNAAGVYRSDDDGEHWRKLNLPTATVHDLAVSNGFPHDPVLMAAVGGGGQVALVSSDGGETWTSVNGPNGVAGASVTMAMDFAVEIVPPDPGLTYLHLPLALKNAELPRGALPLPRPPYFGSREAYLATDGDGVWRSRDAGRSWSRAWAGLANAQPRALAFLPENGDAAALAGTLAAGLYRSPDGGRTYRPVVSDLPRGQGQDIQALAVSPAFLADRTVFLAATSGVWVSTNSGHTWQKTSGPAPAGSLAISPSFASDRTLIAETSISKDGGQSWAPLTGASAPVVFSPTYSSDNTLWCGGPILKRSTNGGETWTDFSTVSSIRNRAVYAIGIVQVVAGEYRVFIGTDRGIYQSFDNGVEWDQATGTNGDVRYLSVQVTSNPQGALVTASGENGVFWTDNRGQTWLKEPTPGRPAWGNTNAWNNSTILAAVTLRAARYGYGSARIYLPFAQRPLTTAAQAQ